MSNEVRIYKHSVGQYDMYVQVHICCIATKRREEDRFARPKTDAEVLQMRATAVPDKTRQDTAYCQYSVS